MGSFTQTTTQTDPGGNNRNDSGSGTSYNPNPVGEIAALNHTLTWIPGPSQVPTGSSLTTDTSDSGISLNNGAPVATITGEYRDLFPTRFFEWTDLQVDAFTPPVYHTGTDWADLPAPADSDLTQFDCHATQDKVVGYTYSVDWVNTSSGATGTDTMTVTDQVYMEFWMHSQLVTERAI